MSDRARDVARDHRPGHIGFTPQPVDELIAGNRVGGMLHEFAEHPAPHTSEKGYLRLPPPEQVTPGGYFRTDSLLIQVTGAMGRQRLGKLLPDPKTFAGPSEDF